MEIRNRMPDIVKLRCNVCQDFLRMVIKPNWQQELYDIAKKAIERNNHADNYRPAFEKMRDIGIENYSIDDMDVTFITQVVCFYPSLVSVEKPTKEALIKLRDDRNLTNHSNENEDDEELYLRGLLSLCDLKNFIKIFDKYETKVDDNERLAFRKKYMPQISNLMSTLDEERIAIVQKEKEILKDISRILESPDEETRLRRWVDIYKLYDDKYRRLEKDRNRLTEFEIKASDAGIPEAHSYAAHHFEIIKKDDSEALRRYQMLFNSKPKLDYNNAKETIEFINCYISREKAITPEMNELVNRIIAEGYPVTAAKDGSFILEKKVKRKESQKFQILRLVYKYLIKGRFFRNGKV